MAAISAALVKDLREKSGAGMMDCKKALTECDGDLEAAVDWLRTKGLAAAAKKAGRAASEGLVAVASEANRGALVEVNAETDFVARNDDFQGFVEAVAQTALAANGDLDAINGMPYPGGGGSVAEKLTSLIATIGENMSLRRAAALSVNQGVVASYMHSAVKPGLGKIGVIVALESTGDAAVLESFGKQLAMHIAATNPQSISSADLDAAAIERERNIFAEQARESGKPENIIEKMIEGRLRKFYEEVCLLEQVFVIDTDNKVGQALAVAAKEAGAAITVSGFMRFALGEGLEKKQEDFAAEVAAVTQR